MRTFSGLNDESDQKVHLPEQLYTDLIPLIDDLDELKVTLACFKLTYAKSGPVRWTTLDELRNDRSLGTIKERIVMGLNKAIERGSILRASDPKKGVLLFINSTNGRTAKEALKRGESIDQIPGVEPRPNIFVLYERTIGGLTPIIAEQLRDAEQEYPPELIEEAFKEAATHNVRKWVYVKAVLESRLHGGKFNEQQERDVVADWKRFLENDKRPKQ